MDLIYIAKGLNGTIEFYQDRIAIVREGSVRKEIEISKLRKIQSKEPTLIKAGFLRIGNEESIEFNGGFDEANKDENAILFDKNQLHVFSSANNKLLSFLSTKDFWESVSWVSPDIDKTGFSRGVTRDPDNPGLLKNILVGIKLLLLFVGVLGFLVVGIVNWLGVIIDFIIFLYPLLGIAIIVFVVTIIEAFTKAIKNKL